MGAATQEVLNAIMCRDPDGGTVEPTEAMYASFEAWAVRTYGRDAWNVYAAGGWARDRTEGDWSHTRPDEDGW